MGRRSRARERGAASAAAPPAPAAQAPAAPAREQGRRSWARMLNPFHSRRLSRARARNGAVVFGVGAILFLLAGRATSDPAWYSSAVLLAVLAVTWGITAALLRGDDGSG
jgi:hypothetical protein